MHCVPFSIENNRCIFLEVDGIQELHRRQFPHVRENRIHHRRQSWNRLSNSPELKDSGVKVVIGSRDLAQGELAAARLRAQGVDADTIRFDVTNPADHQTAYDYFNSKYGRLDILVNNAGIAAGSIPRHGARTLRRRSPARPAAQAFSKPTSLPRSR